MSTQTIQPGARPQGHAAYIVAIMSKEIREIFRERRTIMAVVISPLIITPLLFAILGSLINDQQQKAQSKTYTIGVISSDPDTSNLLAGPHLKTVMLTSRQSAEVQIRSRAVSAAVMIPAGFNTRLEKGSSASVEILDDAGNDGSQAAAGRIRAVLAAASERLTAQRLKARGLPAGFATPLIVTETPIKSGGSSATLFLSMMLPYILIISAFSGTIYAAFDQVAGEKERGTLETLLVTPASRRDIVLGKFGTVVIVCLISSLLTVGGMSICFFSGISTYKWLAAGGVHVGVGAIAVIALALIPLAVLFAGLLLAVSTYARNQKEAQTMLGPLFTLIIIPAVMSMVMPGDVSQWVALAPILNAALIIKQALAGAFNAQFIVVAFIASAAYAAIALIFATTLFEKESVLIKV